MCPHSLRGKLENCCVYHLANTTPTDFKAGSQEPRKLLRIIIQRESEFDTAFHCEALRSDQGIQNETTVALVGAERVTRFHVAMRRISSHLVVQAWGDLKSIYKQECWWILGVMMIRFERNEQKRGRNGMGWVELFTLLHY